jgi:hypothetical protein
MHLPDSQTELRKEPIRDILDDLDVKLQHVWLNNPWNGLLWSGDLNLEMPLCNLVGEAVTGSSWNPRVQCFANFATKWV